MVYFPAVAPPDASAELGLERTIAAAVAVVAMVERKFLLWRIDDSSVLVVKDVDGEGDVEKAWLPTARKAAVVTSFIVREVKRESNYVSVGTSEMAGRSDSKYLGTRLLNCK